MCLIFLHLAAQKASIAPPEPHPCPISPQYGEHRLWDTLSGDFWALEKLEFLHGERRGWRLGPVLQFWPLRRKQIASWLTILGRYGSIWLGGSEMTMKYYSSYYPCCSCMWRAAVRKEARYWRSAPQGREIVFPISEMWGNQINVTLRHTAFLLCRLQILDDVLKRQCTTDVIFFASWLFILFSLPFLHIIKKLKLNCLRLSPFLILSFRSIVKKKLGSRSHSSLWHPFLNHFLHLQRLRPPSSPHGISIMTMTATNVKNTPAILSKDVIKSQLFMWMLCLHNPSTRRYSLVGNPFNTTESRIIADFKLFHSYLVLAKQQWHICNPDRLRKL